MVARKNEGFAKIFEIHMILLVQLEERGSSKSVGFIRRGSWIVVGLLSLLTGNSKLGTHQQTDIVTNRAIPAAKLKIHPSNKVKDHLLQSLLCYLKKSQQTFLWQSLNMNSPHSRGVPSVMTRLFMHM